MAVKINGKVKDAFWAVVALVLILPVVAYAIGLIFYSSNIAYLSFGAGAFVGVAAYSIVTRVCQAYRQYKAEHRQ